MFHKIHVHEIEITRSDTTYKSVFPTSYDDDDGRGEEEITFLKHDPTIIPAGTYITLYKPRSYKMQVESQFYSYVHKLLKLFY